MHGITQECLFRPFSTVLVHETCHEIDTSEPTTLPSLWLFPTGGAPLHGLDNLHTEKGDSPITECFTSLLSPANSVFQSHFTRQLAISTRSPERAAACRVGIARVERGKEVMNECKAVKLSLSLSRPRPGQSGRTHLFLPFLSPCSRSATQIRPKRISP